MSCRCPCNGWRNNSSCSLCSADDISTQLRIRRRDNCSNPTIVIVMQSSFLIFKTLGDGSLYRVDSATTPQGAGERVEALARFWPSIYIICNEITGQQLFIDATGEMKN